MAACLRYLPFRFMLLLALITQSHAVWRQSSGQPVYANHRQVQSTEVSCDELFTINRESYYQKRYEGTLLLRSDVTLRDVEIDLRFDRDVDLLVNYFGTSRSTNSRDFHISKQDHTLFAAATLNLTLEVSFSTTSQPLLEEVRLNGLLQCPLKPSLRAQTIDTAPAYRYPPTSWNLGINQPEYGKAVPLVRSTPSDSDFSAMYITTQLHSTTTRPTVPRNFTDNRENRFNSSCQAMGSNIVITPGRWDGILTLNSDVKVDQVLIEIVFDGPIYILGNSFGEVYTEDNIRFSIENSSLILAADSEVQLLFFIKFNEMGRVPDVREVNFNGRDVCRQRRRRVLAEIESPHGVFGSRPSSVTDETLRSTTSDPESMEDYDENECATIYPSNEHKVSSRIIGGISARNGELPWHVAIFYDDQYQCGGSIVSQRSILTAAHCLTKENSNETLQFDLLKVYIGIVDLNLVDDYFYHGVSDILIHQDYNAAQHTTDIGILKLKKDIIFNSFIKPVCLYRNTTDISAFYSRYGKVAGWGFNRNGVVTKVLNYLDMPVVSQKKCSQTNVQYNTILAQGESFCAGHSDGNSVCNGDSGGGLVFVDNYRYYLRGIVSISAQKRNQLMCDPNRYSVFTDVSKFLKWIRRNIE
ncbi:transmembrane protease serine 11B-like protein isoform X2 [Malaya genurostris]|uniref:transmembrane protease serine 11B-like protein isoform X2 n=1 Tax=Malaya genurostris TaxID=325434 RepID=UPI0026F3BB4D|nr:transmembrane protease serine 11B-like protein isoform X2 [Malaya genurostris]